VYLPVELLFGTLKQFNDDDNMYTLCLTVLERHATDNSYSLQQKSHSDDQCESLML